MFACFSESNYDEAEWPQLWRLEGLVNTVLNREASHIHMLPLVMFVSALSSRVAKEARSDGGAPLDSEWARRALLREAITIKRTFIHAGQ